MILTLPIDRPFTVTIYVVSFSYFIRLAFQRICLNWHACIVDTYKDVSWLFTLHTISNRECFFVVVVGWLKRCANICGIDLRYVYTTIFDYFLCVNAAYIVRIENHVERNWAPNNRCFARVYVICGCCFFFFWLAFYLSHGRRPQVEYHFYTVIFAVTSFREYTANIGWHTHTHYSTIESSIISA